MLLRIKAPDFASRGADLRFLSAFPAESEVLYPPLTHLRPDNKYKEIAPVKVKLGDAHNHYTFTIVDVEPTINTS